MLNGLHKARAGGAEPARSPLELLAHYQLRDPETGSSRSGFALILELTPRRLVLESDVPFASGQELHISFFLTHEADASRVSVAMDCVVAQCRDPEQLHYSARVAKISNGSKEAILRFQGEGDPQ
jgi:hypothetical protein